ncbi:MAG: hypothetical protein ACI81L_000974 [Verrucomicrobiales bacterium]
MKQILTTALVAACGLIVASTLIVGSSDEVDALGNGIIFGAYAQPINGQTNEQAIGLLERELGGTLPMVRAFGDWDDALGRDKPLHRWVKSAGRDLMVSVKPRRDDGSIVTWSQVANAQPGSRIYREMQDLASGAKRYQRAIIVGFHHEPEQAANRKFGSTADFRSAFRAFRAVFDAEGATNVHFAWIMTEWSFEVGSINPQDSRRADFWYPGDDVVDMIASDTYNWNNCRGNSSDPWRSLKDDLAPLMAFSKKHPTKPLILAEFGSDEGVAGRKAEWLDDAQALLKTAPYNDAFAAVLYFHDDGLAEGWPQCDWWLNSTASSLDAAQRWITDGFYRADLRAPGALPQVPVGPTTVRPPVVVKEECRGRAATIIGTSGNDQLRGTPAGDDKIVGGGGADQLLGGPGSDHILGGLGPDLIIGGTGPDRINGQHGNDELHGNQGNDIIRGGRHQDVLFGQGGFDTLTGGDGNDRIEGGVGADTISGGNGVDTCLGGPGRDSSRCETTR